MLFLSSLVVMCSAFGVDGLPKDQLIVRAEKLQSYNWVNGEGSIFILIRSAANHKTVEMLCVDRNFKLHSENGNIRMLSVRSVGTAIPMHHRFPIGNKMVKPIGGGKTSVILDLEMKQGDPRREQFADAVIGYDGGSVAVDEEFSLRDIKVREEKGELQVSATLLRRGAPRNQGANQILRKGDTVLVNEIGLEVANIALGDNKERELSWVSFKLKVPSTLSK